MAHLAKPFVAVSDETPEAASRPAPLRARSLGACLHCGQPIDDEQIAGFCCRGCRAVYQLLRARGLDRFYDLRSGPGLPVREAPADAPERLWLDACEARVAASSAPVHLSFDVQGIHCSGCVWLIEELFERSSAALGVEVNPSLGRLELTVGRGFPLHAWAADLERFGYLLGPARKEPRSGSDGLLLRLGLSLALAANTMLLSAAIYFGLAEGPVHELVRQLCFAMATVTVVVGGSVFVRSAWQGLRRGILHLDLPIAVGVVLAFGASSWAFFARQGGAVYFDTVAVFVALMLLGRWLQERMLERNRRLLLSDEGLESLPTKRLTDRGVEVTPCGQIGAGDELLIAPRDLLPVDAELLDEAASLSLDWISGESAPRIYRRGELAPAGAFNLGQAAVKIRATTAFDASPLESLLRTTVDDERARAGSAFWRRFATVYVALVLLLAAGGLVGWWLLGGSLPRALTVATAVLVVTCPCAFGIATPLAYELVLARLRRAGLFVRSKSLLDRARQVRKVIFDKTGTLTSGALQIDPAPLGALSERERAVAHAMACRSNHPKSDAVRRALEPRSELCELEALEHPGLGLEAELDGHRYRLGAPGWAGAGEGAADLLFSRDGEVLARLTSAEVVRPGMARQLRELEAAGYTLWICSGDDPERARALARDLDLDPARALGGMRPEDKAAWLGEHDEGDTLFLGDGVNDAPAARVAHCSGTPVIDRPFMPARTDFFLTTPGLRPLAQLLALSVRLAQVIRVNLAVALVYNAGAVTLALAGLMEPWLAAVLMPSSSIFVIALTVSQLNERYTPWRS